MNRAPIVARLLLGAVLCAAGLMKVADAWDFTQAIANYRVLPPVGNQLLGVLLPWWEIVIGLFLLAGLWVRASSILSAVLFGAFAAAVSTAFLRGLDIDCGCFGTGMGGRVGLKALAVDLAGLVLSLLVLWTEARTEGNRAKTGNPEGREGEVSPPVALPRTASRTLGRG